MPLIRNGQLPDRNRKIITGIKEKVFHTTDDIYIDSTTVQDKFKLLATGKPIDDLFNISLDPSLNGIKLSNIELAPSNDEFLLYNPNQFNHVDLESNYLPAFVSGRAPSLKVGTVLAVALNGKIVTVTRVFRSALGHNKFAAMLPQAEIRQGKNVLSIHRVEIEEDSRRLYQSSIKPL